MPRLALLALLLLALPASAEQLSRSVDRSPRVWTFELAWRDADGARQEATFRLPGDGVRADLREPVLLDLSRVATAVAARVQAEADTMSAVKARASASGSSVKIDISGRSRAEMKDAMDRLQAVRDAAWEEELAARDHIKLTEDGVSPDHARLAARYAAGLAPVVEALGGPGATPRDFADRALSFVQSIPYDKNLRRNGGFRRPMSVLGVNVGDCDSKAVLFLALMRQAWPEVDSAIVYVKDHAFALVDLDRQRGDTVYKAQGRRWVAVEPVGPALRKAGEIGPKSAQRWDGWRRVRVVPRD